MQQLGYRTMGIIPFLQRLTGRTDPLATLLQSARPLFPEYIGTDRGHASRTLYLVGSALGMAKTYQDSAEEAFEGEVQQLKEHLQNALVGSGARELAEWAFELDDDDATDGINRCVQPARWQERRTHILEAINIKTPPQPSPISN